MRYIIQTQYLITIYFGVTWSWHDISNVDYHCWPLSASSQSPEPFSPACTGVLIKWIMSPPRTLRVSQAFNTTTELILELSFYQWAVDHSFFGHANFSTGITDAIKAKDWCESTVCPSPSSATQENCCIHHMNIHSCPLDDESVSNGLCGPWIPAKGQIITHSQVMVGSALVGNWTNVVPGLYVTGRTSIIAHFKVAGTSIALVYDVNVYAKAECGNAICENDAAEDCSVCPRDCGMCQLEPWHIGLIAASVLIISVIIAAIYGYFAYQRRKLLYDNSWIYKYEKIKTNENRIWMGSMISQGDRNSLTDTGFNLLQVFVTTGDVDGKTVAIKKIKKKTFNLTKQIREEVRKVRQLDHQNVCRFIGGCIEVPNVAIVMAYCSKGSINDVLLNEDIPLSWSFRFSFATDITRGMKYLHGHKIIHGRLWSSNCVVDDRWSVKVTDYGLETFRKPSVCDDEAIKKQHNVYLAPELRKSQVRSSEQSDVYSFSVILIEIATRGDPYGDEDPFSVPIDWQPPLPRFEKTLDDKDCPCPEEYCKLIAAARIYNPMERPTFDSIKRRLHRINPNKLNPVDLVINMMEKYSKHLEAVVEERTQDLLVEKQRTETLLYSMLPKSVADSLKTGLSVQAESFDHCTIYFSDIVGFTVLCSKSTAFQVVALLNKLYTVFDEIIEHFCVYKVETIGDAYMVVSGLPKRIPNHASEIAQMSLQIVDAAKRFQIPHVPNEPLKIRIGLHSGYVCAGVVGRTMPRYCLFGDTVNTASRMESNGEAYKIHISNDTYTELIMTGGFSCEERGVINIKGKGNMQTWWLIAYDYNNEDSKPI